MTATLWTATLWTATPTTEVLRDVLAEAQARGFLGPQSIETQVAHAESYGLLLREAPALAQPVIPGIPTSPQSFGLRKVLDLGSGAGLPGLVVALASPAVFDEMVLLEGSVRRCEWLRHAVTTLLLEQIVTVKEGRAEEVGRDPQFRTSFAGVIVRSFGPPSVVAECAAPLLAVGGVLIVSEPPETDEKTVATRWPANGLSTFGLSDASLSRTLGFSYAVMTQETECSDRYPRRVGIPSKRPLF